MTRVLPKKKRKRRFLDLKKLDSTHSMVFFWETIHHNAITGCFLVASFPPIDIPMGFQETIERFLPGRPSTSATVGGALKEFREVQSGVQQHEVSLGYIESINTG